MKKRGERREEEERRKYVLVMLALTHNKTKLVKKMKESVVNKNKQRSKNMGQKEWPKKSHEPSYFGERKRRKDEDGFIWHHPFYLLLS